jgi:hypothetical protein
MPLSELVAIWIAQRDASKRLIDAGRLSRRKKNQAMNGVSPTIWLQDDRAPEVAQALWGNPAVEDLAQYPMRPSRMEALQDDQALENGWDNGLGYNPRDVDERNLIQQPIRERRGQQHFRDLLRVRFGDCCLVTGCTVLAVLEAAHIKPYQGEQDNHPENGLLLRADVHTLFDLDLLGIEPSRLCVELHPSVVKDYRHIGGKILDCTPMSRPSKKALKLRYEEFRRKLSL